MRIVQCDKCGKKQPDRGHSDVTFYIVPTDEESEEGIFPFHVDRNLCEDCMRKLKQWIDGMKK